MWKQGKLRQNKKRPLRIIDMLIRLSFTMLWLELKKGIKMKKLLLLITCSSLLFACSSSDDGGSTGATGGVTYTGVTTPASITPTNYDTLAGSAVNGSSGGQAIAVGALSNGSGGIDALSLSHALLQYGASGSNASVASGALQSFNQTINGADTGGSGTLVFVGQIDDVTQYGTLTVTYNQFDDGSGTVINGTQSQIIDASGITVTFTNLSIQDVSGTTTLGGTIKFAQTFASDGVTLVSDTITLDFTAQDTAGNQIKLVNFSVTSTYDTAGWVLTESVSGRFYDSAQGYLDITTTTPLVYSPAGALNPSSGGPIIATGANNTKVRITPIDATNVLVEADTTGDGNYDQSVTKAWSAL